MLWMIMAVFAGEPVDLTELRSTQATLPTPSTTMTPRWSSRPLTADPDGRMFSYRPGSPVADMTVQSPDVTVDVDALTSQVRNTLLLLP